MTRKQLLDSADSAELGDWMALYRLEHEQVHQTEDVEDQLREAFGKKS